MARRSSRLLGFPGALARLLRSDALHLGVRTDALAARYGDRVVIESLDEETGPLGACRWTAGGLHRDVVGLCARYRREGLSDGRAVLLVTDNRVDTLLHVLALARAGAIATPVNPRLKTGEIREIAEATGARGGVVDRSAADAVRTVLGKEVPLVIADESESWRSARDTGAHDQPPHDTDPRSTVINLCTSGTTGASGTTSKSIAP